MKSLAFIAATFLAAVNAASVTFKVVAPSATDSVNVSINGKMTPLKASDPDVPYFVGTAEYDDGESYKYVVDGEAEDFERKLSSGTSTRNEFFSRNVTYADLPEIPNILSEGAWTKGDVSHPIWDTNYIPTIFVTGEPENMEDLIENVPPTPFEAKITYIGPDEVYTFEQCSFGLHKPGRKNNDAKQTWTWSLPDSQSIGNRNWFKIRHMEEDPTQLREKLYADIARAMGTYANAANMVRFYINKEGMGTFNMLDDVSKYSYINAMFYAGNPPAQQGGLFDGGSGADFNPSTGVDGFIANEASPLDPDALTPFMEAFNKVDFSNDAEVEAISEFFDYDQFLRFMVMEYLTGSWDGYWQEQTNNGAYISVDPTKMYYLAQDFDASFGVNLPSETEFTRLSYTDYKRQFSNAYLIDKLLSNEKTNAKFQDYLNTTYHEIFNLNTLKPIVEARHQFYWPEIVWDRSIQQRSPGNIFGWTAEQSHDNLYEPVTAAGGSGGGAGYGLLEWVGEMEKTLSRTFGKIAKPKKASGAKKNKAKPSEDIISAAGFKAQSASAVSSAVSSAASSAVISPSSALVQSSVASPKPVTSVKPVASSKPDTKAEVMSTPLATSGAVPQSLPHVLSTLAIVGALVFFS